MEIDDIEENWSWCAFIDGPLIPREYKCIAIVRTNWYNKDGKRKHFKAEGVLYVMATKSANLYARIEPDVKEQAESILAALGIPASNAINMFSRLSRRQSALIGSKKSPIF